MANINVTVTDGNNIVLSLTPPNTQVVTIDRGIAGPVGPAGPTTPPGGSTTQVQYNNAGAFAGSANLTFDGANLTFGVGAGAKVIAYNNQSLASLNTAGSAYSDLKLDASNLIFRVGSGSVSEGMRLTSTGLGIGTASPSAKLDVKGGATISTVAGWNTLANSMFELANPAVRFGIGYDSSDQVLLQGFDTANTARNIGMQVYGGNVGIGTASPGYRLDLLSTASAQLRLQNTDATSYASMLFTGTGRSFSMGVGNASETGIQVANQFYIYDNTAGQTRLRLDSSGNLGLGVTPSASVLPSFESQYGLFLGATESNSVVNSYFGTGSVWRYKASGITASMFRQNGGQHQWCTAPSGTAGAAIAFTQAMTLDASGNLLVGQTTGNGRVSATQSGAYDVFIAAIGTSGAALTVRGTGSVATSAYFITSAGYAGSITNSGTTTNYATSSDYRLKNITGPITTSGAYIDSLKPVEGTWKADGSTFVGLIAHETQEASRTSVATGTKDGEEMQGMDYSSAEIIANLIAEIQSLRKRLSALEAK